MNMFDDFIIRFFIASVWMLVAMLVLTGAAIVIQFLWAMIYFGWQMSKPAPYLHPFFSIGVFLSVLFLAKVVQLVVRKKKEN